ncbi:alkaline phosphatase D family protein [Pontibacter locisalis]|uniref:Alkaline phosphatase D family protein n=1 Tax=Pontibacter locisalis TaxID=1719035 RepID=A0ABW5IMR2_9BACT
MKLALTLGFIFLLNLPELNAQDIPASPEQEKPHTENHIRIAFGSCNDQREAQPLWPSIVNAKPDLWVWLGDNIYADTRDMQNMALDYQLQLQQEGYQRLLATTPVTGIWDDHDFGYDNAGGDFDKKAISQQLFLDFMGVPRDAAVREQQGIYRSYELGEGDKKVKILLLDVRYFRDNLYDIFGLYLPNWTGDVLGEAQWQWLEQELKESDAAVNIIASGLQVLPTGKAYTNWSAFPAARERLLSLLERTRPSAPIILSGDRHVGELSKMDLRGLNYPLYEVTSSGMTHFRNPADGGNNYRIGKQVGALNFGILDIYWKDDATIISMQIRGKEDHILLENEVIFPAEKK